MNDEYNIKSLLELIKALKAEIQIAKEGLKAIEESGETNIARKTLDELDKSNESEDM